MTELFAERPWSFFVESEDTPKFLPRFGGDARRQFKGIFEDTYDMNAEELADRKHDRLRASSTAW